MDDPGFAAKSKSSAPLKKKPKRFRWIQRFFYLLALFGILGWFAPTIVATTDLRNHVAKILFANFPGEVQLGEISLGWMSPISIKNLKVTSDDGTPLFELGEFSTSQTLWSLVSQQHQLGTLTFVEPRIHVLMRDDGSNIEDILTKFLGSSHSGRPLPDMILEVTRGKVELEHAAAGRQAVIDPISFRMTTVDGGLDEVDFAFGTPSESKGEPAATDWLAVRCARAPEGGSSVTSNSSRQVTVRASGCKLERFGPLLPRIHATGNLQGEFDADASIVLAQTEQGIDWDFSGTTDLKKLVVTGIEALKRDTVTLDQISLGGRAAATQGRLAMHDLKLVTDIGQMTATGDIPIDIRSEKSASELIQSLLCDEDYHIAGQVDLKKLAGLLPHTLRIREGIEITAGIANVSLVGASVDGVRRWSGSTEVDGLIAANEGQPISWDKPVAARVIAHRDQQAIVVDLIDCKSEFLQVAGKGTLDDARFSASGDLSKLLENIERFVDLGVEQLSGRMKAEGQLKRRDDKHVTLTSTVVLDDFASAVSKNNVWREQHLVLSIAAAGQTDSKPALTTIETGEVHLISNVDSLDLVLQKPLDLTSKSSDYAATARVKGNLTTWQSRLQPIAPVNDWKLAGRIDLTTSVSLKNESIDLSGLTVGLANFVAVGPEWLIQDPELRLETSGRWDGKLRQWVSPKTSIVGKTVAIDVTGLELATGPQGIARLIGTASYRADLAQVCGWKNLAIRNPSHYLIGSLAGTAGITRKDNLLVASLDAHVEKLVVAGQGAVANGQPQWVALWKEPSVQLTGKGSYDASNDKLILESSRLEVDGLSIAASGKLDDCMKKQAIELTGQLAYDWDVLTKRFGSQVRQNIQITGKDQRPFTIKGSLASLRAASDPTVAAAGASHSLQSDAISRSSNSPSGSAVPTDLTGNAGLGWTTASVYGINASAGDVLADMGNGICKFAPIDLAISDGKLHLTPTVYLDRNPFVVVLPQERVLESINLTPELCTKFLKFVAPMLGDSAQIDGKFSAQMNAATLPLFAPSDGSAEGELLIQRVQARPGPLAMQIVQAIDQVQSILNRNASIGTNSESVLLEMPEQQVPFKLEQRRMYHQGMTFLVNKVSVKTTGSVGMDTTLSLLAEISVRDEWLGNNKVLAGLQGKSIQIPIAGTTSRPQIDPAVFSNLVRQLGDSAVENLLQEKVGGRLNEAVNDGLDKLLKGRR